jgi:hypothetical protein
MRPRIRFKRPGEQTCLEWHSSLRTWQNTKFKHAMHKIFQVRYGTSVSDVDEDSKPTGCSPCFLLGEILGL